MIYQGAAVTIVASRAGDVHEGFLHDRHTAAAQFRTAFELPYRTNNGSKGIVTLRNEVVHASAPLDARAWTLQERLLSTRVLDYGDFQTTWRCPCDANISDGLELRQSSLRQYQEAISNPLSQPEHLYEAWNSLVQIYSQRNLTFPADRILAISGLAERFSQHLSFSEYYVAGMWSSAFPACLLWTNRAATPLLPRAATYQGPSWSWVAINTPVVFPYSHPGSLLISLVHCETIPRSQKRVSSRTKFGALQSARLELKGRLRPAEWKKSDYSTDSNSDQALRRHGEGKGEDLVLTFGHDTLEDDFTKAEIESISVFILVIFKGNKLRGLILRSNGAQAFSRVGSFDVYADTLSEKELDWLIAGDLEIITIV